MYIKKWYGLMIIMTSSGYNPKTKGDKLAAKASGVLLLSLFVPMTIIVSPALLLIAGVRLGFEKVADLVYDANDKKKHERRLKEDWHYRLIHTAPTIANLKLWKERVQDLNQYERACLQS